MGERVIFGNYKQNVITKFDDLIKRMTTNEAEYLSGNNKKDFDRIVRELIILQTEIRMLTLK